MYYYVLFFISIVITLGSQSYINSMYKKSKKISSMSHMSGRDVARKILDQNGLKEVKVQEVSGTLTDHYDPRSKTVNLSTDIYQNDSLASISVAAHECGHAIQDKDGYFFLRFRNGIVPFVNLCSRFGYIAIMIGAFFSLMKLVWVGIAFELGILLFQLVTLPVEFDASKRALKQILELNIVEKKEHKCCRSMLVAAALTYVASVAATLIEIFRLFLYATSRDDR